MDCQHQKTNKTILVCNLYKPPQGNIDNFIGLLEEQLVSLDLNKSEVTLMGDFNIDIKEKLNENSKKKLLTQ